MHLTDLGDEPLRVLKVLKAHPSYGHLAGASLLKLKHQLPLPLLDDSVSVALKDDLVHRFEALGARVKVVERVCRHADATRVRSSAWSASSRRATFAVSGGHLPVLQLSA
ncbi:MAG TPA: hypothetical protein VN280_11655 [Variovorax sp.]|nr:hypothetical protein [Variovorax sp.]